MFWERLFKPIYEHIPEYTMVQLDQLGESWNNLRTELIVIQAKHDAARKAFQDAMKNESNRTKYYGRYK